MNTPPRRGMVAYIYRAEGQRCSNGGLSDKVDQVLVVGDGIPEVFEESPDHPAVWLEVRGPGYVAAKPFEVPEGAVGPMFGGAFVHCGDSRFPIPYPIRLHDRFETPAQYAALTAGD